MLTPDLTCWAMATHALPGYPGVRPEVQTACYAESLRRPFALLALITALPPRVAMRARKPCVRFRLRLLGWKVCFIYLYRFATMNG